MQPITSNDFVIFLHIQKTGGITLQRMLRRQLGRSIPARTVALLKPEKPLATAEQALQQKKKEDRYVVGHFCYGIHRLLPQPFTYMTFLREPVGRIISLYNYSKTNPTAYYHSQAANKSLEEFALETQLMELDNGQVRFIAGDAEDCFINRTPIGKCEAPLLETAKQNIENHFSFVGLTDYFDHSVLLLQKIMDWESALYLRRNSSNVKSRVAVSEEVKQKIAERNYLDVELYEYAKEMLIKQLESYGLQDGSVGLENFRRENTKFNAKVGPLYTTYSRVKAIVRGQINRPA